MTGRLLTMVDTTEGPETVRRFTASPDAVAGYGGQHNRFQNAGQLFDAFPHARHVLIVADSRDHPARAPGVVVVLDIERGNSTPDVGGWIREERSRFGVKRPPLYFDLSDGVAVMRRLHAAGINDPQDYAVWAARPNGVPSEVQPGAFPGWVVTSDAAQYLWSPRGINIDVSVCAPGFFGPPPLPPAPQGPLGIPQFAGSFDIQTGRWRIAGTPGWFHPSPKGRTAAARITVDLSTGRWGIRPLPWIVKALTRK